RLSRPAPRLPSAAADAGHARPLAPTLSRAPRRPGARRPARPVSGGHSTTPYATHASGTAGAGVQAVPRRCAARVDAGDAGGILSAAISPHRRKQRLVGRRLYRMAQRATRIAAIRGPRAATPAGHVGLLRPAPGRRD